MARTNRFNQGPTRVIVQVLRFRACRHGLLLRQISDLFQEEPFKLIDAPSPTILVGAVMHESNTFTRRPTPLAAFAPVYGDEVRDFPRWMTGSAVGGIVKTLDGAGVRVLPSVFGHARPSGVVERAAYDSLRGSLLDALNRSRTRSTRERGPRACCSGRFANSFAW